MHTQSQKKSGRLVTLKATQKNNKTKQTNKPKKTEDKTRKNDEEQHDKERREKSGGVQNR